MHACMRVCWEGREGGGGRRESDITAAVVLLLLILFRYNTTQGIRYVLIHFFFFKAAAQAGINSIQTATIPHSQSLSCSAGTKFSEKDRLGGLVVRPSPPEQQTRGSNPCRVIPVT